MSSMIQWIYRVSTLPLPPFSPHLVPSNCYPIILQPTPYDLVLLSWYARSLCGPRIYCLSHQRYGRCHKISACAWRLFVNIMHDPWNCETWTNIPVPKQHKWNDKKMNVQQRHLQTLQTKLKKRASVTRYLGLNKSSIVPSVLGAEAWGGHLILEQLPLFLSCWRCKFCWHWIPEPLLRRLYPNTWRFDLGTQQTANMGDTNHFSRAALYTLYHITFYLLASLSCSTGPQVMFNWSPDNVQLVPIWCSTGPKRMFNWSLCQINLQLSLTYLTDDV